MRSHAASGLEDRTAIDAVDRRIIAATQAGLPLTLRPYHALARQLGLAPGEVLVRVRRMLDAGIIRRIAAVPNHYRLGYRANGMSVWDIPDRSVDALGARIGALEYVSHCYRRPRHGPFWPYNLFAMVHGRSREEVNERVARIAARIAQALGGAVRYDVLFSTRILKKTGLRLPLGDGVAGAHPGMPANPT